MKKLLSICVFTVMTTLLFAQVSKTLNITTAGTLTTLLTATEKTTVTDLTLTGTIDARDVKCMRDEITNLSILDISDVNIVEYNGTGGTDYTGPFPMNEMPKSSFGKFGAINTKLTSVKMPNTLTSIGEDAFSGCAGLSGTLLIPSNVTFIGHFAFFKCSGLTGTLTIPNSVKVIDYAAFEFCSGITEVVLPNSLTTIGSIQVAGTVGVFNRCTGLTSITIPNSVTFLGNDTFNGCTNLTSIILPETIETIGKGNFDNTKWLNDQADGVVYIQNYLVKYKGIMPLNTIININNGTLLIAAGAFEHQTNLISITIPNTIKSISSSTFSYTGLANIEIPISVNNISSTAFLKCSNLVNINVATDNTNYTSQNGVLFNKNLSKLVTYPNGKQGYYTIPNSVDTIGAYSFYGSNGLTGITFGNSIKHVEPSAFYVCNALKNITCLNPIPATLGLRCFATFDDTNINVTTIYVPLTSVSAYKAASGWSTFTSVILANPTTKVLKIVNNRIKVYGTNSKIIVDGTSAGETVTLFTVNGKEIQTVISKGEKINLTVERNSIYLVKTATRTFKVTL